MKKNKILLKQILILTLCVMSVVSVSFSWFGRGSENGNAMQFEKTVGIRGEGCTIATYLGALEFNQVVNYDESTNKLFNYTSFGVYQNDFYNNKIYFKTNITNPNSYDTKVSLYFGSLEYTQGLSAGDICIGVSEPTKTYWSMKSNMPQDGYYYYEPYTLVKNISVGAGKTVSVEWFIHVDDDVNISSLIVHNLHINYI